MLRLLLALAVLAIADSSLAQECCCEETTECPTGLLLATEASKLTSAYRNQAGFRTCYDAAWSEGQAVHWDLEGGAGSWAWRDERAGDGAPVDCESWGDPWCNTGLWWIAAAAAAGNPANQIECRRKVRCDRLERPTGGVLDVWTVRYRRGEEERTLTRVVPIEPGWSMCTEKGKRPSAFSAVSVRF